jgi:hypothetical protein
VPELSSDVFVALNRAEMVKAVNGGALTALAKKTKCPRGPEPSVFTALAR